MIHTIVKCYSLVLLLYMSHCLVLSLRHAEVSKDQDKEDRTRVDPEEPMQSNGFNDVSRCLDSGNRRDHHKARGDREGQGDHSPVAHHVQEERKGEPYHEY